MADFYDEEKDLLIEDVAEEKNKDTASKSEENDNEYEDVCFVCRRPESKAGRMFKLPNNSMFSSAAAYK